MKYFETWIIYLIINILFVITEEKCNKNEFICEESKVHGMWSADCYSKNFEKFPQCLRSDVEAIDLTYNRLRKVTRDDLAKYTSLKMLYLSDNIITNIDDSTFQDLTELISLDLSLNPITKLPPLIFQLPSLKRLYLSQNQNMNIIESVEEAKPITSPLEAIHVAFNELETLPNFGIMPHLLFYNISGNNLLNFELKDLAGMCNLNKLANNNSTISFNNPCDCWNLQRWLREREVKFTRIPCEIKENECEYNVSDEDKKMYEDCKGQYQDYQRKSALFKIGIPVVVGASIILLIIIYFICRRRKQRQRKSKLKQNLEIHCNMKGEKEGVGLI